MSKRFRRIVALLLLPFLVADAFIPACAATVGKQEAVPALSPSMTYEQALASPALWERLLDLEDHSPGFAVRLLGVTALIGGLAAQGSWRKALIVATGLLISFAADFFPDKPPPSADLTFFGVPLRPNDLRYARQGLRTLTEDLLVLRANLELGQGDDDFASPAAKGSPGSERQLQEWFEGTQSLEENVNRYVLGEERLSSHNPFVITTLSPLNAMDAYYHALKGEHPIDDHPVHYYSDALIYFIRIPRGTVVLDVSNEDPESNQRVIALPHRIPRSWIMRAVHVWKFDAMCELIIRHDQYPHLVPSEAYARWQKEAATDDVRKALSEMPIPDDDRMPPHRCLEEGIPLSSAPHPISRATPASRFVRARVVHPPAQAPNAAAQAIEHTLPLPDPLPPPTQASPAKAYEVIWDNEELREAPFTSKTFSKIIKLSLPVARGALLNLWKLKMLSRDTSKRPNEFALVRRDLSENQRKKLINTALPRNSEKIYEGLYLQGVLNKIAGIIGATETPGSPTPNRRRKDPTQKSA